MGIVWREREPRKVTWEKALEDWPRVPQGTTRYCESPAWCLLLGTQPGIEQVLTALWRKWKAAWKPKPSSEAGNVQ